MKRKKSVNNAELENEIQKKILIVKKILDNVYDIMVIFKPLLGKMIELEKQGKVIEKGRFNKAAMIFGEISNHCKELQEEFPFSPEFLKNIPN
jgi:hypothetical protein